ncbi:MULTISPECIES: hypothetical protein [Emticicia]|uniref:hypothetical protein n=1 Tax=Emticicia TaxID=312278 RepID=UPI0020A0C3B6|nr:MULTISPECIES: hypothetical protein [Emticicia]UTA69023.1 hypothetical protein MB380_04270 [Emticicia sp. 21SJ11W-3]
MSTAEILYEQYKVLPIKVQKELKALIIADSEETVSVAIKSLKKGLKEVKLLREGKIKARPISELFKELENGN